MKFKLLVFCIFIISTAFQCDRDEATEPTDNDNPPIDTPFTPTSWTRGNGTESNPYLIENAEQLVYLSLKVNETNTQAPYYTQNRFEHIYFKITNDINMANIDFEPIGKSSNFNFLGNLNGNSKIISNLKINSTSETEATGLFGYAEGNFKNIILSNCEITGVNNVGGICGFFHGRDFIRLETCSVTGIINGKIRVGGIIGQASGATTTELCTFDGTVTGESDTGGIVGELLNSKIRKCVNRGVITSMGTDAYLYYGVHSGGITGSTYNGYFENCINKGLVKSTKTAGGIVGHSGGPNYMSAEYNEVKNCYNMGDVKSTNGIAAGIMGYRGGGEINYTFTTGRITSGNSYSENTQPIAANNYGTTTSYSFCLKGTVGNMPNSGYEESFMKSADLINELNYDQAGIVWKRDPNNQINNGFPYLAWEE
ncbi:MAG TPA: hypothetical protein VLB74_13240 [Flavobacterium sp.]|uniref:hypothetical protein n=1 Tax=Flavobacterium sp. TaxID=239 RepID=UPI002CE4A7D2|nr:hypothetical protein [Flavobacterium sp.]HSD15610.1 hypothetical protein [Flavobacterium sp.]